MGRGADESFSKISFSPSQSGRRSFLPERIRRRCETPTTHPPTHRRPSAQSQAPCPPPVLVNCVKQIFVTSPYSVWEASPVTLPPCLPQMERSGWCRGRADTEAWLL